MNPSKSMLTAILGLAMIAMPITAAAGEHHRGAAIQARREARAFRATAPVRSFAAPARAYRNNTVATFVPVRPVAQVNRFANPYPVRRAWATPARYIAPAYNYSTAPAYLPVRHNEHENCDVQRNSGWVCDEDGDDCHQVGGYHGNYYGNYNSYATPYAYGGANNRACIEAQRLANQYRHDMRTGHPAAAQDVLRAMRRAENACSGRGYYSSYAPANNGLFGGLLGAPAYSNYGANNGYGYNNYNNGYGSPYYGNGAGSMLGPLIQQFIP